jgi:two-component system response regulator DctR
LRRLCQSLGVRVGAFGSGVELLEALDSGSIVPDCLVLDAHMPDMTGLDVLQQLVARGVPFPTVVYSADDEPEALDRYIAAGAVAYHRKPIRGDQLILVIERVVAASRAAGIRPAMSSRLVR